MGMCCEKHAGTNGSCQQKTHGRKRYRAGCRCEVCRGAEAAAARRKRQRAKARQTPMTTTSSGKADMEWQDNAACRTAKPELFFPNPLHGGGRGVETYSDNNREQVKRAKAMCFACPVRSTCLEYALEHERHGIWGGLTPRERHDLAARRKEKTA